MRGEQSTVGVRDVPRGVDKSTSGPALDKGYRNCVINVRFDGDSYAYRVTFPSGQSFGDGGFVGVEDAFKAAREFINQEKR